MTRRLELLDALRGIAVCGILLANVGSFVWGAERLPAAVAGADAVAVFLTAFIAEVKFYPLFAFLFGAGFALQIRALKRQHGLATAQAIYERRLNWLLACGLIHGLVIWFGDILSFYALCGYWLLGYAGARLHRLIRALKLWGWGLLALVALGVIGGLTLVTVTDTALPPTAAAIPTLPPTAAAIPTLPPTAAAIPTLPPTAAAAPSLAPTTAAATLPYVHGDAWQVARQRANDYFLTLSTSLLSAPHTIIAFIIGILAVRLGWLTHPHRHVVFWQRCLTVGLAAGIPANALYATVMVLESTSPGRYDGTVLIAHFLQLVGGPLLTVALVAAMALQHPHWPRVVSLFAPVGKMALTNYIMQSVVCVLVLQGVGLGLGATVGPADLLALVAVIWIGQFAASRWWLARHDQGPLEALWRRYTYARA